MIRVILPAYLQRLANIGKIIEIDSNNDITIASLLDLIEANYPMLVGTIRDHKSGERREYLRFFACGQDLSHSSLDEVLPMEVLSGKEPFRIVGAMSGG